MENPATWGDAERLISSAIAEHDEDMRVGLVGLSLVRRIADKLRAAGYKLDLVHDHGPDNNCQACYNSEPPQFRPDPPPGREIKDA